MTPIDFKWTRSNCFKVREGLTSVPKRRLFGRASHCEMQSKALCDHILPCHSTACWYWRKLRTSLPSAVNPLKIWTLPKNSAWIATSTMECLISPIHFGVPQETTLYLAKNTVLYHSDSLNFSSDTLPFPHTQTAANRSVFHLGIPSCNSFPLVLNSRNLKFYALRARLIWKSGQK